MSDPTTNESRWFAEHVQPHEPLLRAWLQSRVTARHEIDDIVQDTFIAAWRTIDRLRDDAALRPWLYGIAKNLGLKARRRARRTPIVDVPGSPL